MGRYLRLLPFEADLPPKHCFTYTVLNLGQDIRLWGPIDEIEARTGADVPENFNSLMGGLNDEVTHWGPTVEVDEGVRLQYVRAQDLVPLSDHVAVKSVTPTRAAWAYLRELPPETKVALYWIY